MLIGLTQGCHVYAPENASKIIVYNDNIKQTHLIDSIPAAIINALVKLNHTDLHGRCMKTQLASLLELDSADLQDGLDQLTDRSIIFISDAPVS